MRINFKKGSSLILSTLIMAGIVVVVFGGHRLTLVQFNQSTRDEDKLFAYYAAKAAVEDGLARFRFNRDVETQESRVFAFNLTEGQALGANEVTAGSPRQVWGNAYKALNQYYDLKINFKKDEIGFNSDPARLSRDGTLQLSGFSEAQATYYLRYRINFLGGCNNGLVQLQQIRQTAAGEEIYEQVTANKPSGNSIYDSAQTTGAKNMFISTINTEVATTLRLRAYGCDVDLSFQTVTGQNNTSPAGIKFDGLETTITATGYFAGAKRTLIAKVDRGTGRLISIYDFNVYAGQGTIQP